MSHRTTPHRASRPPRGMTLIEVMIVLLIVAGMLVGGMVLFDDLSRADLKAQTLRVSGTIKYAYGQAAVQQRYHRLVIDIDSGEYWVEISEEGMIGGPPRIPESTLIGAPDNIDEPRRAPTSGYAADDPEGSVFGLQRPAYSEKKDLVLKRRTLKEGIKFHSVFTPQSQDPIISGKASITFFPTGFVERSQIVLNDGDEGYMTMELAPLTGRVTVLSGKHEVPSDFLEVEEDD